MEVRPEVLLIILGSALATIVPRVAPLVLLARVDLPAWAKAWLSYVPISILASLLAGELFAPAGRLVPLAGNAAIIAIVPVIAVAWFTRSIIGAVLAGIAAIALLRALAGA